MKCDFCSKPDPKWAYPAENFEPTMGTGIAASEGGWAACDICHTLIESGHFAALTNRSWETLIQQAPEANDFKDILKAELRQLHEEFAAHRTGPSRKLLVH
jgi:hypothetical protein